MGDRRLQERCDWGDLKDEWQDSQVHDVTRLSPAEAAAWCRARNKENKAAGDCTRFRTVLNETDNW